jgi:hypothetical protein
MKKNIVVRFFGFAVLAVFIGSLLPISVMAAPIKLNYANFPPAPTFPCVQMRDGKKRLRRGPAEKLPSKLFLVVPCLGQRI